MCKRCNYQKLLPVLSKAVYSIKNVFAPERVHLRAGRFFPVRVDHLSNKLVVLEANKKSETFSVKKSHTVCRQL